MPDAELDYLAEDEVALIDGGLDYLEPVWRSADWRLYRVRGEPGLAGDGIDELSTDELRVDPGRAGGELPLRWSRYWRVTEGEGCVTESEDGMTVVEGSRPLTIANRLTGDSCPGA